MARLSAHGRRARRPMRCTRRRSPDAVQDGLAGQAQSRQVRLGPAPARQEGHAGADAHPHHERQRPRQRLFRERGGEGPARASKACSACASARARPARCSTCSIACPASAPTARVASCCPRAAWAASRRRSAWRRRRPASMIRTGAAVDHILIENDAAAGVVLSTGEEIRAPRVVSNADPQRTAAAADRPAQSRHHVRLAHPPHAHERLRGQDPSGARRPAGGAGQCARPHRGGAEARRYRARL